MRFRKWLGHRRLRFYGAPIYIHWSVFAAVLALAITSTESPVYALVTIGSYLGVIVIHEMGHAFVARKREYDVLSIRIAFLHGRCEYEAPEYEWDDVAIAWGGVLAQLLVAVPILVLASVLGRGNLGYFGPAVVMLGSWNLVIALINLVPAAGLDGALAWRIIPLLRARHSSRTTTQRILRRWKRR